MKSLLKKQGNGREGLFESMDTQLAKFRDELDRAVERVWRGGMSPSSFFSDLPFAPALKGLAASWPAIDVAEDDKGVTIRADVPGMEAKDVNVEVIGNTLCIRGERQEEKETKDANVWRSERSFGSFERTIALPDYIDTDKLEAKYDKGTLKITAPRIPGEAPKRVEVKAAT
jgi:HSP20 family protein